MGEIARDGRPAYSEIGRGARPREMDAAFAAAQSAGLWRFDVRLGRRPEARV